MLESLSFYAIDIARDLLELVTVLPDEVFTLARRRRLIFSIALIQSATWVTGYHVYAPTCIQHVLVQVFSLF